MQQLKWGNNSSTSPRYILPVTIQEMLIELRDSILGLMDMHRRADSTSQNPIYLSAYNPHLIDAYLEMISVVFAVDEVRANPDTFFPIMRNAISDFNMHKFLFDPIVLKHIE